MCKSIFALIFAKWLYWILNRVKKSEVWWVVCCWVSSMDFCFFVCCKCRKLFGITRNKVLWDSSFLNSKYKFSLLINFLKTYQFSYLKILKILTLCFQECFSTVLVLVPDLAKDQFCSPVLALVPIKECQLGSGSQEPTWT